MGDILIALNPFQSLGLYSTKVCVWLIFPFVQITLVVKLLIKMDASPWSKLLQIGHSNIDIFIGKIYEINVSTICGLFSKKYV